MIFSIGIIWVIASPRHLLSPQTITPISHSKTLPPLSPSNTPQKKGGWCAQGGLTGKVWDTGYPEVPHPRGLKKVFGGKFFWYISWMLEVVSNDLQWLGHISMFQYQIQPFSTHWEMFIDPVTLIMWVRWAAIYMWWTCPTQSLCFLQVSFWALTL